MAIAIKFDEAVGCYFVRWTGNVTAEEYHSEYKMVVNQPWFRKGLPAIHDRRNATMEFTQMDVLTKAGTWDMVASIFGEGIAATPFDEVNHQQVAWVRPLPSSYAASQ